MRGPHDQLPSRDSLQLAALRRHSKAVAKNGAPSERSAAFLAARSPRVLKLRLPQPMHSAEPGPLAALLRRRLSDVRAHVLKRWEWLVLAAVLIAAAPLFSAYAELHSRDQDGTDALLVVSFKLRQLQSLFKPSFAHAILPRDICWCGLWLAVFVALCYGLRKIDRCERSKDVHDAVYRSRPSFKYELVLFLRVLLERCRC